MLDSTVQTTCSCFIFCIFSVSVYHPHPSLRSGTSVRILSCRQHPLWGVGCGGVEKRGGLPSICSLICSRKEPCAMRVCSGMEGVERERESWGMKNINNWKTKCACWMCAACEYCVDLFSFSGERERVSVCVFDLWWIMCCHLLLGGWWGDKPHRHHQVSSHHPILPLSLSFLFASILQCSIVTPPHSSCLHAWCSFLPLSLLLLLLSLTEQCGAVWKLQRQWLWGGVHACAGFLSAL